MQTLADNAQLDSLIADLARSIHAAMDGPSAAHATASEWAMVGIRSRGDILAARLVEKIGVDRFEDRVGAVDITLYRDDLSEIGAQPIVRTTDIAFAIDGLNVVLVDDVLTSGATASACAKILKENGACEVNVLTLARTA